ncbi:CHASE3 domain-containing protein [Sphingomonas bacterium]|uniref:CHASE3 domain-containing protein n=1 Tax=Sphingomonas bacterium TaxID=1895847 RepID=UPI0020C6F706|nr:CHASE3 domain-containing protein [Sphingomonas bacterium]
MGSLAPRRIPFLPLAGLTIALIAGIGAILIGRSVAASNSWVDHTIGVQVAIVQLEGQLTAEESAMRGYMLRGDAKLYTDLATAHAQIQSLVRRLREETRDNPTRRAELDGLTPLIDLRHRFAMERVALRRHYNAPPPRSAVATPGAGETAAEIRARLRRMFAEEQRLLTARQKQTQALTTWLSIALAGTVVLVVIVAYLTVTESRNRFLSLRVAHREARAAVIAARAEMQAREEVEAQLRQIQKIESIGQLTGGIAHDFNNMLAVVVGSLELAQRRAADPIRLARHLADAREGAERAATLVTRLFAFSRRQALAPVAIEPNRLVATMRDLFDRTLGESIVIRTDLADEPWRIHADAPQLENALLNLAVNARDAMDGKGVLTIATRNHRLTEPAQRGRLEIAPGHYVEISVADTGTGMSEETRDRAFDPFFTTKSVGKGTGLGLSQVFGFVKQSGGHVLIESAIGDGATIRILLPRFEGEVAAAESASHADGPQVPGHGGRVLVVEDDDRVRHISCDALRELGYDPLPTADGEKALALLQRDPTITLVFSDVVMPVMSGPQLAIEARKLRPGLPILFTSGYTHDGEDSLVEAGQIIVPKPFTIDQLAAKLREVGTR